MKANIKTTPDTEYLLQLNDLRLRVAPFGASLRGFWRGDDVIVTEYSGAENNIGSQGDVLMPFPSRIPDGRYIFEGQSYQLPPNDNGQPHAMHGFLRSAPWQTTALSETAVTFAIAVDEGDFPGYPFSLRVSVTYFLLEDGLRCDFQAENVGTQSTPFGAGFHPYCTVGSETVDRDILQIPLQQIMQKGEQVDVTGTPWDFREPRPAGDARCDTVYSAPVRDDDGRARIRLASRDGNRAVNVWMDETFSYMVLYSGDTLPPSHQRRALAIEPWTCAPNAFNYPERGLSVLGAGDSLSGSWGVSIES